ncbi:MAG TPA: response regulator transcription factor, partial [Actinomycetales bacterium]|nr:response regulator transcription factor [Actinomycetales bacterium]
MSAWDTLARASARLLAGLDAWWTRPRASSTVGVGGVMIRIVIADDQDLIRTGLRTILEEEPDMEVVGEADSGVKAARLAAEGHADIVLMDVEMPGGDGITGVLEVTRVRPEVRVIMLTTFDLDEYVFGALRAGASAFLLKSTSRTELVASIRQVHDGQMLFAPTVARRLVETYVDRAPRRSGPPEQIRALTERELEVFLAIARGLSNAEIAHALYLGEATVRTHVTRILSKLGLRDRIQAVVLAYETG